MAIPAITPQDLLTALELFDLQERNSEPWLDWEMKGSHHWAIAKDGKHYPVKHVISLATGADVSTFSGGTEANTYVQRLGFDVVPIRATGEKSLSDSGPRYWWVNQGQSHDAEHSGGYLFASTSNDQGRRFWAWDTMAEVRSGDIVVHYHGGMIRTISRVTADVIGAPRPTEAHDPSARAGQLVQVRQFDLEHPIERNAVSQAIVALNIPNGPMTSSGTVKQAYLCRFTADGLAVIRAASTDTWPEWLTADAIEPAWLAELRQWVVATPNWKDCPDDGVAFFRKAIEHIPADIVPNVWLVRSPTRYGLKLGAYALATVMGNNTAGGLVAANPDQFFGAHIDRHGPQGGTNSALGFATFRSVDDLIAVSNADESWESYVAVIRALPGGRVTPSQNKEDEQIPLQEWLNGAQPRRTSRRAWLFQANPSIFDLAGSLQVGRPFTFTVNQYRGDVQVGDRVYLWESGPQAGLVGTGRIIEGVTEGHELPELRAYWQNPADAEQRRPFVLLEIERVLSPRIARTTLKADPRLARWSFLQQPAGTNFPVPPNIEQVLMEFMEATPAATTDLSFDDLLRALAADGLFFPAELVAQYLLALQTKRFVIFTGISGTGKTQLAMAIGRQLAAAQSFPIGGAETDPNRLLSPADEGDREAENVRGTNTLVVAVRPDWTDGRGLLGYFNPLIDAYVRTPFLDLVLRAHSEVARAAAEGRSPAPFFVVLDEMNLARVEHYFSDFLSALESGEALDLYSQHADSQADPSVVPAQIQIPPNLFFTGTVNVDETTYMFSPKVLDRAFTIEFNTVDLLQYGNLSGGEPEADLWLQNFSGMLTPPEKPTVADWLRFKALAGGALAAVVLRLQESLAANNRHFGYRVANEIARFVVLASEQAGTDDDVLWTALDLALLAKVLPKFHGTQSEIEEPLEQVLRIAIAARSGPVGELVEWQVADGQLRHQQDEALQPGLPRLATKVRRMLNRLTSQGYGSFIE